MIAGKVIAAAKRGNEQELAAQNKEWYRNADDMAKLLSGANPNWSFKELQDLLYTHLKLLTEDAMARLKKDWNGSIAAFDKGEDHLIKLADALSKGIIKQFRINFKFSDRIALTKSIRQLVPSPDTIGIVEPIYKFER